MLVNRVKGLETKCPCMGERIEISQFRISYDFFEFDSEKVMTFLELGGILVIFALVKMFKYDSI